MLLQANIATTHAVAAAHLRLIRIRNPPEPYLFEIAILITLARDAQFESLLPAGKNSPCDLMALLKAHRESGAGPCRQLCCLTEVVDEIRLPTGKPQR